jgi:hypothetical protein
MKVSGRRGIPAVKLEKKVFLQHSNAVTQWFAISVNNFPDPVIRQNSPGGDNRKR